MKTKNFWSFIAAAVIMTLGLFTSCEKMAEEEILPEVIESTVKNVGLNAMTSSKFEDANGCEGIKLSYSTWADVEGTTRSAFSNRVEVMLNDVFMNKNEIVYVPDFLIGEAKSNTSYKSNGTRREGYVLITDSVLVYRVEFEKFAFEYELNFEVAVYDDGVSRVQMPYHQITIIKDNGYKLTDMDSSDDGETAYARKELNHSISVETGGQTYEVSAKVELRKVLGSANSPYVLRSSLIDEEVLIVSESEIVSKMNVYRLWSNGVEQNNAIAYSFYYPDNAIHITPSEVEIGNYAQDLQISHFSYIADGRDYYSGGGDYISVYQQKYLCTIDYGYFSIKVPIELYEAIYDDGVLRHRIKDLQLSSITAETPELSYAGRSSNATGSYNYYWLNQKIKVTMEEFYFYRFVQVGLVIYDN